MGPSDRFDPDATPPSVPRVPGDPSAFEPTAVLPVQPTAPLRPGPPPIASVPDPLHPDPRYPDPLYTDPRYLAAARRREGWPYLLAVLALLLGGLAGFLIGRAVDDDRETLTTVDPPTTAAPGGSDVAATFDMLLARTQADGEYRTPSEYPQLDEITAIDTAAATAELENQIATLTAAQGDAEGDVAATAEQVAALEAALDAVTAERDALAAQAAESGADDTEMQTQLDAANDRIASLEADLATARADLDTATADLRTAQTELDAATAELEALNVMPAPNYVNGDVAKARSDASANGWTLIEEPAESNAAPGTVLEQAPPANSNMVRGSVLLVTVAGNP